LEIVVALDTDFLGATVGVPLLGWQGRALWGQGSAKRPL